MKKTALALALAAVSGLGISAVNAATVTGMTLGDVINTDTNGAAAGAPDGLGTDGRSGAFRFSPINADTYAGASLFGPTGTGAINVNAATAPTSWTAGFLYAGSPFQPFTTGPIVADITGSTLTISSLPFAGYYVGADFVFNMTPDSINVINLIQTSATDYAYRIGFSHYITSADDPSLAFVGFTANWILEGTMSTAVPVPAAAWLMGSGLLGLAGVARRRRSV